MKRIVLNQNFNMIFVVFLAMILLTGCEQASLINDQVMQNEMEADSAIMSISPDGQAGRTLQINNQPWYGANAVPITKGQSLPSHLNQDNAIVMTFAGAATFSQVLAAIQDVTGVPMKTSNNIYTTSAGTLVDRTFLPTGAEEVAGGRLVWSGRLSDLLNQVANNFGAEWSYDGYAVHFSTEITKTFMLNALSSSLTMSGNASSSAGGGTANIPDLSIDGTTTLEIWDEITGTVESIIGDRGNASFSPSTGAITVTTSPSIAKRVEAYLKQQNQMRLRRVAISVKVLTVRTSDTLSVGTDIAGIIKGALGDGLSLNGSANSAGGLSLSILESPTQNTGDITAKLEATEGIERVSIAHSGSLVTLSDQPAPLQVGRQIAYLERVSSTGGDASSVSLEPGTLDVGLFMTVLPRIVSDDKILMRLSIALTDADTNFRTFGTDTVRIELPEVDTTGFLQNAVVSDGETMVLAGFEKNQNSLNDAGSPGFILGGTRRTNRARDLTVLIINSQILPEQPITVIGQ